MTNRERAKKLVYSAGPASYLSEDEIVRALDAATAQAKQDEQEACMKQLDDRFKRISETIERERADRALGALYTSKEINSLSTRIESLEKQLESIMLKLSGKDHGNL